VSSAQESFLAISRAVASSKLPENVMSRPAIPASIVGADSTT
jgi:hypothetical protein